MNMLNLNKGLMFMVGLLIGLIVSLSFIYIRYNPIILPEMRNIAPKEAYQNILENRDKVIFIDVRSENEYMQAHASGSVNLPIHHLYDDTHGLPNEKGIPVPKNTNEDIYLICSGGRLAGVAFSYLEHYGYRNIRRVEGGLKAWSELGLPVITKPLFDTNTINEKSYNSGLDRPFIPNKNEIR